MRDAVLLQDGGQQFALLDGDRADQDGLLLLVAGLDLFDDRRVFRADGFVDDVVVVDADHRLVGRDFDDVEHVDLAELVLFGHRRSGHAGELVVHAEVVLEGDRRERLVLAGDLHALLGLDRLMQAVRIPPAGHDAAGERVDDQDLAVLDDVVDVQLHIAARVQGVVDVVHDLVVFGVAQVFHVEEGFRLPDAVRCQDRRLRLFVDDVVLFDVFVGLLVVELLDPQTAQAFDELVRLEIHVTGLLAGAGNDQRGAHLVDQDAVHLVDDGEMMASLQQVALVDGHIVAQVVEPELVVGSVGDVRLVRDLLLLVRHVVRDEPDGHA